MIVNKTMALHWKERCGDLREIATAIRDEDSRGDSGAPEVIMSADDAETCDLAAACVEACEGDPNLVRELRARIEELERR